MDKRNEYENISETRDNAATTDVLDHMNAMIEDSVNEMVMEDNFQRMKAVRQNFLKSDIYNIWGNLALWFTSILAMYLWFSYTAAGVQFAMVMDEATGQITFPWYAVTAFVCLPMAIISFIGNNLLIKKLNKAGQILYLIVILFSAANLILRFEPMKIGGMIILLAYGFIGLYAQDLSTRNYSELDYLSGQEGYPDFNYLIYQGKHSRYVHYRERWLKREKRMDYYSPEDRPAANIITDVDKYGMETVGLSDANLSPEPKKSSPLPPEKVMDGLDTSNCGINSADYPDPNRKRPLL